MTKPSRSSSNGRDAENQYLGDALMHRLHDGIVEAARSGRNHGRKHGQDLRDAFGQAAAMRTGDFVGPRIDKERRCLLRFRGAHGGDHTG